MAGSRLEKIGTIFARNSGLLQSRALKWEDRPMWYDVYARFPPFDKPEFDRPVPNIKLRNLFYKEDRIRALQGYASSTRDLSLAGSATSRALQD